jgi:hypothetical protein
MKRKGGAKGIIYTILTMEVPYACRIQPLQPFFPRQIHAANDPGAKTVSRNALA